MIPIRDENPTRSFGWLTLLLILVCSGIYFFVQPTGHLSATDQQQAQAEAAFDVEHAAIPCEISKGHPLTLAQARTGECNVAGTREFFPRKNVWAALVYSMFLHGSLLHLGGNMLFLWIFGNNVEDTWGRVRYLGFYLAAGIVATLGHVFADPGSVIPVIGASGAIAGVMGAYFALYPGVKVDALVVVLPIRLPARFFLGFWLVSQFFIAPGSGVAWVAHVTGFVFGLAVGALWRSTGRHPVPHFMR